MGTKVDLRRLAVTLDEYGYAYLMTTTAEGRPHAVAVRTALLDDRLYVSGFGWRSRANATEQRLVTLVYPPPAEGGYSLIVDGAATVREDDVVIAPEIAVLHRPPRADAPPPGAGCLSDCQRLETE